MLSRVTTSIPAPLHELAKSQSGVVSRGQVLDAGMSSEAIAWQLRRTRWQQLQWGVYAVFTGQPGREAILWAAVLRAGQDAVLSHQTAGELARLTDKRSDLVHLTIPAGRRVQPIPGLVIHRSTSVERITHPCLTPPRTRVEETVLDLTGLATTLDDACDWVTRACGRGLTTEKRLLEAMALRTRLRWRGPLTQILSDPGGGVHSVLEFRYYRDVERAHCLPSATRQVRVVREGRSAYRDAYYSKYRVAVELDGRVAHPGDTRWRDIRRDNAAAADGGVTLRYGWSDVTQDRCRTAGELARVLVQRGWVGVPKLCSPHCTILTGWL